jgi:hypothetical protein
MNKKQQLQKRPTERALMRASLDWQRNRRGMIQAFVSDEGRRSSSSMAFLKQTRSEGDYVYTRNLRYDPRLGKAPESGHARTFIGGAEQ